MKKIMLVVLILCTMLSSAALSFASGNVGIRSNGDCVSGGYHNMGPRSWVYVARTTDEQTTRIVDGRPVTAYWITEKYSMGKYECTNPGCGHSIYISGKPEIFGKVGSYYYDYELDTPEELDGSVYENNGATFSVGFVATTRNPHYTSKTYLRGYTFSKLRKSTIIEELNEELKEYRK